MARLAGNLGISIFFSTRTIDYWSLITIPSFPAQSSRWDFVRLRQKFAFFNPLLNKLSHRSSEDLLVPAFFPNPACKDFAS